VVLAAHVGLNDWPESWLPSSAHPRAKAGLQPLMSQLGNSSRGVAQLHDAMEEIRWELSKVNRSLGCGYFLLNKDAGIPLTLSWEGEGNAPREPPKVCLAMYHVYFMGDGTVTLLLQVSVGGLARV
jgi:hypothetical protein